MKMREIPMMALSHVTMKVTEILAMVVRTLMVVMYLMATYTRSLWKSCVKLTQNSTSSLNRMIGSFFSSAYQTVKMRKKMRRTRYTNLCRTWR
jgi:hypothetical protein